MRDHVRVRLDLVEQAQCLDVGDDLLPRDETVERTIGLRHAAVQPAEIVEDVDLFEVVAFADLEVVEVVRRRDLDRAVPFSGSE